MSFESLGAQQMKNIAESIITYRVSLSAIAARPTRVAALPPNAVAKPPAGVFVRLMAALAGYFHTKKRP